MHHKLLGITMVSLLLISCNSTKSADIFTPKLAIEESYNSKIDYSNYEIKDYTIEIQPKALRTMLETKQDFCFYIHQDGCAGCESFKPLVIRYILESKNTLYSINVADYYLQIQQEGSKIKDANGEYLFYDEEFNAVFQTPTFYFFKDGAIKKKQLGTTNLLNYNLFKKTFNKYLVQSSSTMLPNETILSNYTTDKIVYYYNNDTLFRANLFKEILENININVNLYNASNLSISPCIVNYATDESIEITDETTIASVLDFLNVDNTD